MEYKVNEIFLSLQGEGHWAGVPMCFVRLAGCNLNCPWCDTIHSEKKRLTEEEIFGEVCMLIGQREVDRVCITGGEPTLHSLEPLADEMADSYLLHLETNGTRALRSGECFTWVTVSPKFPPGLERTVQYWGNELKVPVWPGIMDSTLEECLNWGHFQHRYLQPVNGPDLILNARRCLELASRDPWRVSMQGHKRLGLR